MSFKYLGLGAELQVVAVVRLFRDNRRDFSDEIKCIKIILNNYIKF